MATSVADLLGVIETSAAGSADRFAGDDAALALGALARALEGLCHDGFHHQPGGVRDIAVGEITAACRATGAAWRGERSGRLTELSAVTADVVGGLRSKAGQEERWALATSLADTARRLAQFARRHEPYASVPQLARVVNTAATVARLAAREPPSPRASAMLDGAVPPVPTGMVRAGDAAMLLVADIDAAERRVQPLRLGEVLAITGVAEHAAQVCAQAAIGGDAPWQQTPSAWWAVRHSLAVFDDGTRRRPPHSDVPGHALQLHTALREYLDPSELCTVANQLPEIARQLRRTTTQWGRAGLLIVRADRRPPQPHRVGAFLRRTHVRVTEHDMEPVRQTIYTAGLLATALAAELDRVAQPSGAQPQPRLAAAYAARIANLRSAETLARRANAVARRQAEVKAAASRACQPSPAARRSR